MAQPGQAPMDNEKNELTINADGTYSPGSISISNRGVARFDVTYPTGMNVCSIAIGAITFSESGIPGSTGGTVKIGS